MEEGERNIGQQMSDDIQQMLKENGDAVGIDTPECYLHRQEYKDCLGCKYRLGCCKLSILLMLPLLFMGYEPSSFVDFIKGLATVMEMQQKVFDAKTVEDAEAIIGDGLWTSKS